MSQSRRPPSADALAAFERLVGSRLPAGYRQFLRRWNGGHLARAWMWNEDVVLGALYGLGRRGALGLQYAWRTLCSPRRPRLPGDVIPIGEDPFGNFFCLAIAGRHRGAVFFWDHELEVLEGEAPTRRAMKKLTSSFEAFVARLRPLALS